MLRPVSVVVNTLNRAASLELLLDALDHLDYPEFEVVVVAGPCTDGTAEVLERRKSRVKVEWVEAQNLSASRNVGIRASSGEIVAFIDDDAYPDPRWLRDLVPAFDDEEVAAAGGLVLDHTGHELQARYSLADRWGRAWIEKGPRRLGAYSNPDTWIFPYTMGTNALFRRDRLVSIGGFDENFAFYLDETDVCLRLLDRGWTVAAEDKGLVYHKFLPSGIRNDQRITTDLSKVLFSRAYFSGRHGLPLKSPGEQAISYATFVNDLRADLAHHVGAGRVDPAALGKFDADVAESSTRGFEAAAAPAATRPPDWFRPAAPLHAYGSRTADRPLTVCVVSKDFPPGPTPGIGRASATLAAGLAGAGHTVHVVAHTDGPHGTVDFEDGVWVHRVRSEPAGQPAIPGLPQPVWDRAHAVLREVAYIHERHRLDVVQVPNWDSEGLLVIEAQRWPTVLYAYTPVLALVETDPRFSPDSPDIRALVEAERRCYRGASLVSVSFPTTMERLEREYSLEIPAWRRACIPLGIPDVTPPGAATRPGTVEVLFVGRLEPRKGIDTLLAAIPSVCARAPQVRFRLIGRDVEPAPGEPTYREAFAAGNDPEVVGRVEFAGSTTDEEVLAAYEACDIFVAPSRFESFGLINVEAMRFSKPVVSTRVNGVASVVRDGEDGILVEPGDPAALAEALVTLAADPALRDRLGAAGRRSFEERFELSRMIDRTVESYRALLEGRPQPSVPAGPVATGPAGGAGDATAAWADRQGRLLRALRCPTCRGKIEIAAAVECGDGRVKDGVLTCPACSDQVIGRIHGFQVDLVDVDGGAPPPGPAEVASLGERRVDASDPAVSCGEGWARHGSQFVSSRVSSVLHLFAACTDVRLRLLRHPGGGGIAVRVDGVEVARSTSDLPDGSASQVLDVASGMSLAQHHIEVVVTDLPANGQVVVDELILLGPVHPVHFPPPAPFSRCNPYSDQIRRFLAHATPDQLVLECGGGDRRLGAGNQINMEYLPLEGPDLRADVHRLPFGDGTFDFVFSQAVFEHVANPFDAAAELTRVCKPGGLILTEVAFMQPLHAVPFHYFNMTLWGVEELFRGSCDIVEGDWFGDLSFTVGWLLEASGAAGKLAPERLAALKDLLVEVDGVVDHDGLRPVASGVWIVARRRPA